ncbi:MAG: glycosyltransferase family 2 protein [Candidatus Latescibacterota bacterium]|nr:MAG: glycosyltransferase family 2 protein [Candidatus Latescibacterota bacterium]
MDLLSQVTIVAYIGVLGILSVYGLHRYFILYLYFKYYRRRGAVTPPPMGPADYPRVTVQLPIFNEYYVAERVIDSVGSLDYPRDRLTVQILDDSTDDTQDIARAAGERLAAKGFNVQYLHRNDRSGFKAGALAAGLERSTDELVAIFDADFVVPSDFLMRTVPYFQDERVGMVQSRWGYLNRDYSLLTRLQSILLDGHFMLEHTARFSSGRFFNFNGTGGVFRRIAIDEAGGWEGDTLTEDLDLSYRAQMAGWKFVFVPGLVCRSELPVDIFGFKNQQHRWTKGSIQVGKKLLAPMWRSRLPLRVKLEATFHLTANLCYLLIVLLSLLLPLSLVLRHHLWLNGVELWEILVFVFTTVSVFAFYLTSQREIYPDWKWRLKDVPMILALGIGMCINNAWAVSEALLGRQTPFVRTAKYRIENLRDNWKRKIYRSINSRSLLAEIIFSVYMCATLLALFKLENWGAMPYLLLFVTGYLYILGLSLFHAKR